jgi:hypothetical protein
MEVVFKPWSKDLHFMINLRVSFSHNNPRSSISIFISNDISFIWYCRTIIFNPCHSILSPSPAWSIKRGITSLGRQETRSNSNQGLQHNQAVDRDILVGKV